MVKSDSVIGLAIHVYGFLLMVKNNIGPNSAQLRDIRFEILVTLTFQGHLRSNPMARLDSPYLTRTF